jgi:hypothetical protein
MQSHWLAVDLEWSAALYLSTHAFFILPRVYNSSSCLRIFLLCALMLVGACMVCNFRVFAQGADPEEDSTSPLKLYTTPYIHVYNETEEKNEVVIPISRGYVHGKVAYFIATDTSNNETASSIFENTGWHVNFAPSLAQLPNSELSQGFEFLNGVKGPGAFGFQLPVASSIPDDENYTPLVHLNLVRWNENAKIGILKSAPEIILANQRGDLQIIPTNVTINSPAVIW